MPGHKQASRLPRARPNANARSKGSKASANKDPNAKLRRVQGAQPTALALVAAAEANKGKVAASGLDRPPSSATLPPSPIAATSPNADAKPPVATPITPVNDANIVDAADDQQDRPLRSPSLSPTLASFSSASTEGGTLNEDHEYDGAGDDSLMTIEFDDTMFPQDDDDDEPDVGEAKHESQEQATHESYEKVARGPEEGVKCDPQVEVQHEFQEEEIQYATQFVDCETPSTGRSRKRMSWRDSLEVKLRSPPPPDIPEDLDLNEIAEVEEDFCSEQPLSPSFPFEEEVPIFMGSPTELNLQRLSWINGEREPTLGDELSREVVETILRHLDAKDLCRAARVSRNWNTVATPLLWRDVSAQGLRRILLTSPSYREQDGEIVSDMLADWTRFKRVLAPYVEVLSIDTRPLYEHPLLWQLLDDMGRLEMPRLRELAITLHGYDRHQVDVAMRFGAACARVTKYTLTMYWKSAWIPPSTARVLIDINDRIRARMSNLDKFKFDILWEGPNGET